jgi:MIP family channel proteins
MAGTYLLVLIGPASVVVASYALVLSSVVALTLVALSFGCTVASVIVLFGKHSGAHINPAVTVANTLAGTFRRELTVPYVAFQVLGACLAGLSLRIVFGSIDSSASLGSTKLAVGITPVEGFALEFLGTFVLATSALCASSFIRNPTKQAIIVGATLFALIMLIGPLTGASFNPARSFGPSLFSGYFDDQILYWSAPLLGAGCGGLIFGSVKKFHGRRKYLDIVCMCP